MARRQHVQQGVLERKAKWENPHYMELRSNAREIGLPLFSKVDVEERSKKRLQKIKKIQVEAGDR